MYKKTLLLAAAMMATNMLTADTFVVKKQKKGAMKVTCGDELSQALKLTPDMLRSLADIQDMGMEMVEQMLEGAFFESAAHESLSKEVALYKDFNDRNLEIYHLLEEQKTFLRDQQKKHTPKKK